MLNEILDVVIASNEGPGDTLRCLRSGQSGAPESVRWIVASSSLPPPNARLDDNTEWLTLPGAGIPALRAAGFARARADRVAFTEGFCLLSADWARSWLAADFEVATGSVSLPPDASALTIAVAFFEYGPFLRPIGPGRPGRVAGNNFAASRAALARATRNGELHEIDLGPPLQLQDDAVVTIARQEEPRPALAERLRCGREYGMLRRRGRSSLSRAVGFFAGPAIFFAQIAKQVALIPRRPARRKPALKALPWLLLLCSAWSLGEWLGWAFGPSSRRDGTAARSAT